MNFQYCWHRPGKLSRSAIRTCRNCSVAIEPCVCSNFSRGGHSDCIYCEGSGWVAIVRSKLQATHDMLGGDPVEICAIRREQMRAALARHTVQTWVNENAGR